MRLLLQWPCGAHALQHMKNLLLNQRIGNKKVFAAALENFQRILYHFASDFPVLAVSPFSTEPMSFKRIENQQEIYGGLSSDFKQ